MRVRTIWSDGYSVASAKESGANLRLSCALTFAPALRSSRTDSTGPNAAALWSAVTFELFGGPFLMLFVVSTTAPGRRLVAAFTAAPSNDGRVLTYSCGKQRCSSNYVGRIGLGPFGQQEFDGVEVSRSGRKGQSSVPHPVFRMNVGTL